MGEKATEKPDYIKEHLRLVSIEVSAKNERLGMWAKEEKSSE